MIVIQVSGPIGDMLFMGTRKQVIADLKELRVKAMTHQNRAYGELLTAFINKLLSLDYNALKEYPQYNGFLNEKMVVKVYRRDDPAQLLEVG